MLELPSRLNEAIKLEAYGQAVKYWLIAAPILEKYIHMTSFQSIQSDCVKIVEKLKGVLKERLRNPKVVFFFSL